VFTLLELNTQARHQWLTPVILATQEAEIRRITVQRQPQANMERPYLKKKPITKKGWWSGQGEGPEFKP
jgi:hypothetical protein